MTLGIGRPQRSDLQFRCPPVVDRREFAPQRRPRCPQPGDAGGRRSVAAPSVVLMASKKTAGASDEGGEVQVIRSRRRRRTISARRDGDRTVVMVPAGLSAAEERRLVDDMLARLARKEARAQRARPGDTELATRAAALSTEFLAGRARPISVRWVTN